MLSDEELLTEAQGGLKPCFRQSKGSPGEPPKEATFPPQEIAGLRSLMIRHYEAHWFSLNKAGIFWAGLFLGGSFGGGRDP